MFWIRALAHCFVRTVLTVTEERSLQVCGARNASLAQSRGLHLCQVSWGYGEGPVSGECPDLHPPLLAQGAGLICATPSALAPMLFDVIFGCCHYSFARLHEHTRTHTHRTVKHIKSSATLCIPPHLHTSAVQTCELQRRGCFHNEHSLRGLI